MTQPAATNGHRLERPSVPDALQAALAHHQAGRIDEAEAIYRDVLTFAPENGDALHLMGVANLQRGQPDKAVELIKRAILFKGDVAAYHNNLGNALKTLGKSARAADCYRQAITLEPALADAHNNLGALLLGQGAAAEAETAFRRALSHAPNAAETHSNLGLALRAQNRSEAAADSFRRALISNPGHVEARTNLSLTLLDLGRREEARREAEEAARRAPRDAAALTALGNAHAQEADWERAAESYRRAISADPGHAHAHNNLGHALSQQDRLEEAISCFQKALFLDPLYADALSNLGSVLFRLERLEAAAAALTRAIRSDPDNAEAHHNLGQIFERQGRIEDAEAAYRRAISLDASLAQSHAGLGNTYMVRGQSAEAEAAYRRAIGTKAGAATGYYGLSRVKRFSAGDPDLADMEALADEAMLAESQESRLRFALAKAYDDVGDYDRAFTALARANALKSNELGFDMGETEARYRAIEEAFSADFLARNVGLGDPSETPVFIVGMPRSGTTLVEQILDSHREAHGAGELLDLPGLIKGMTEELAPGSTYPDCLPEIAPDRWKALGARYATSLAQRAPEARRITDKLPENHQRLGFISLILPRARIIHCRRDPVDTCLSCYRLLFTGGQKYSYDLADLGLQYRLYDRLMAHWHRLLPDRILELRYEDLVADQEAGTRRILAHCGLDWDPACLRFHESDRQVMTASATQVRRPIYRDSVRKWRRYERHLRPLLDSLGDLVEMG